MKKFETFSAAISDAWTELKSQAKTSHSVYWQGVDISKKPEMAMHEIILYSFQVPLYGTSLRPYQEDINPNLPWADIHFEEERVSGEPINPGESWKIWPYSHSAARFLNDSEQFNHTYAERYWPKYAGKTLDGRIYVDDDLTEYVAENFSPAYGIKHELGDLDDVVRLLDTDPLTRQAYLPVWFPEDTALPATDRKPCTLGYHFLMRDHKLHVVYYIRSCDFVRHFRDDIYLTIRLVLWVLEKLRAKNPGLWNGVNPGDFVMHITSLHMFRNDFIKLKTLDE